MAPSSAYIAALFFVDLIRLGLPLHPRIDAEAGFFGVAFGVEGEKASQDFVAEGGGPEQPALVGVIVLVGLVEEDRLGALGQIVPAVGTERGTVHLGVQLAQADDVVAAFIGIVEAIVSFGQPLIACGH